MIASSYNRCGTVVANRVAAPNCCPRSPISGLRNCTLKGPSVEPPRGPASRCSMKVLCGGVIASHVSGMKRSSRRRMVRGSGRGAFVGPPTWEFDDLVIYRRNDVTMSRRRSHQDPLTTRAVHRPVLQTDLTLGTVPTCLDHFPNWGYLRTGVIDIDSAGLYRSCLDKELLCAIRIILKTIDRRTSPADW